MKAMLDPKIVARRTKGRADAGQGAADRSFRGLLVGTFI
jgi:hypothetical protein